MTTYNTGNPLGSSDPRDLYDNAENLDNLVNGEQPSYDDRLGESRKSWAGIEQDFADFLASSGYQPLGDYAAGIEVTAYNQVIRDGGEFWRAAAGTELPYTTTGAGLPEGGAFVSVGDAVLRQELNANTPTQGSDLLAHTGTDDTVTEALDKRTIYVGSVSESFAGLEGIDGALYQAIGYRDGSTIGGAAFQYTSSVSKSLHDGINYVSPTVPPVSAQTGDDLAERENNFKDGLGETDPSGSGVFVRLEADKAQNTVKSIETITGASAAASNNNWYALHPVVYGDYLFSLFQEL